MAIFALVPALPFMPKVHWSLIAIVTISFLATFSYNMLAFPFSSDSPLKVYFQQTLNLDTLENQVRLTGVAPYLRASIVAEIPSAYGKAVDCRPDPVRAGLQTCTWSGLAPNVVVSSSDGQPQDWLHFNATRLLGKTKMGRISVGGADTRNCRLYFLHPITSVYVSGASGNGSMQEGYAIASGGLREVRLWSRTWERTFEVTFGWEHDAEAVVGEVACEWAELVEGRIPAFDEVVSALPRWAAVTKYGDGLVEGTKVFAIST